MSAVLNNMSDAEIEALLTRAPFGRLGLSDDNIPYVVPVSFSYMKGTIYFHSALQGKKTAILETNPNVCFQVDEYIDGHNYKSVIIDGVAHEVRDAKEIATAFMGILAKAKTRGIDRPDKLSQVAGHKRMMAKMDPEQFKTLDSTSLSGMIEKMAAKFQRMMKIVKIEIKQQSGRQTD